MALKTVTPTTIRHTIQVNEDTGKEYKKCSIQTKEITDVHGDPAWIGGWASDQTYSWRLDEPIEIEIETREYNGKTYFDFKSLSLKEIELQEENEKLKKELEALKGGKPAQPETKKADPETGEIKETESAEGEPELEDLPF